MLHSRSIVTQHLTSTALLLTCLAANAADLPGPVEAAVKRLALDLHITSAEIAVVSFEAVQWPAASLGAPQPGMMYAQMVTGGYRVILSAQGQQYEVHTNMRTRAVVLSCPSFVATLSAARE